MTQHDPLDLRGQERTRADREIRAKLLRESEESDVRWLMGTRRGRRIVWRLLDRAGVFRSTFSQNSMQMAFAEGKRDYGLGLLASVHALCADQYPVMVKEATDNDDSSSNTSNPD
jgi:hypothetical protein